MPGATKAKFIDTEEAQEVKRQLELIANDEKYNTAASYSANELLYPDNLIPFVDKHMKYLISHPQLDPEMYLANVRLLTRIR